MAKQVTNAEQKGFQNVISPLFLLRVGGLPIDIVDDLCFKETKTWVEALLFLEDRLTERKGRLVDVLHKAVNTHKEDRELRRKLINLKRDVFNVRMPSNLDEVRCITDSLSLHEYALLNEWLDLWDRYRERLAAIPEVFTRELYQKRAQLKEFINIPDFRKGVLLSSPLLDQAIDTYIASDTRQLNRQARTVERSLVEYLFRTACKTSPFSTFTAVCAGTFDDTEAENSLNITFQLEGMDKKSFTRLNMAVLSKLSSLILASPEISRELPVQIMPGWHIQNNRIRYLRRMQSMDEIDEEAAIVLDVVHENVFYLPLGRLLNNLLELMGDGRKVGWVRSLANSAMTLNTKVQKRRSKPICDISCAWDF